MKHLIKTSDELKKFVRINISVLKESFLPYENDAREQYLLKYLGQQLHDELLDLASTQETYPDWVEDDQEKKDILDKVLMLAQNAHSKFILHLATPHLDLQLTEMGFVVQSNTTTAPASAQRVENARNAFLEMGYNNIETLLRYLEKHHNTIESYKDSEAYVFANNNYINSTAVFDSIVPINNSRLKFIELKPEMNNIESLLIDPLISKELGDHLRTRIRNKQLSAPEKKLLDIIQRTVAHQAVANIIDNPDEAKKKERMTDYARNYFARIKQLLDKNPDDYPLYKESDNYVEEHQYKHFDYNDDESSFYVAGHP
jgi:hypothetical protein